LFRHVLGLTLCEIMFLTPMSTFLNRIQNGACWSFDGHTYYRLSCQRYWNSDGLVQMVQGYYQDSTCGTQQWSDYFPGERHCLGILGQNNPLEMECNASAPSITESKNVIVYISAGVALGAVMIACVVVWYYRRSRASQTVSSPVTSVSENVSSEAVYVQVRD
jgi:hypothetical protein